jgi:hypothetical protein
MHESSLIRDLMARVEIEAGDRRVAWVRFEIGALAETNRDGVVLGVRHYAEEVWGYVPEVHAQVSDEVSDPGATGVLLVSIGVEA